MYGALHAVCRRALRGRRARRGGGAQILRGQFPPRPHHAGSARAPDSSPATTSRSSTARAFRPANSTCRSIAARPTCCRRPARPPAPAFPTPASRCAATRGGKLVPYYDRGEIEDGALDGKHLEICWIRDPTDAVFIQIQGSARIRLEDGLVVRINYDSHNGYPYTPIGRVLIDRKLVPREEMSMDRIRQWMHDNPDGAKELRRQNRAFVFFRIVGLGDDEGPLGAQGMPLTPGRSIAVDKALHVYGTPFFIDAGLPIDSARASTPFRRADDRAGHRLGDRRPGARRSLLGRRQAGRPGRRPRAPSRPLRHADPARDRSGRGGRPHAAAAAAAGRADRAPAAAEGAAVAHRRKAPARRRSTNDRHRRAARRSVAGASSAPRSRRCGAASRARCGRCASMRGARWTTAEPVAVAPARPAREGQRKRSRPAVPPRTAQAIRSAAARRAGAAREAAARARPHRDRRAHRSARHDPGAGALPRWCASCGALRPRREIRAGHHRQGRALERCRERGVLRRQVPLWLQLPELRDAVVGFEEAHVAHGGEGALYVRLRKAARRK